MKKIDLFDDSVIEKYALYFLIWKEIPFFTTAFLIVIFFILFIIATLTDKTNAMFFTPIIGLLVCFANYYISKILVAFPILHIHYLKKISELLDDKTE